MRDDVPDATGRTALRDSGADPSPYFAETYLDAMQDSVAAVLAPVYVVPQQFGSVDNDAGPGGTYACWDRCLRVGIDQRPRDLAASELAIRMVFSQDTSVMASLCGRDEFGQYSLHRASQVFRDVERQVVAYPDTSGWDLGTMDPGQCLREALKDLGDPQGMGLFVGRAVFAVIRRWCSEHEEESPRLTQAPEVAMRLARTRRHPPTYDALLAPIAQVGDNPPPPMFQARWPEGDETLGVPPEDVDDLTVWPIASMPGAKLFEYVEADRRYLQVSLGAWSAPTLTLANGHPQMVLFRDVLARKMP